MKREELIREISKMFEETERAHRQASGSRESDPDWALFYAQHMKPRMAALLGRQAPCVELVRVLMDAEEEHQTLTPDQPWQEAWAIYLVDRCVAAESESLSLYYYPYCGFCRRVTDVINQLGIKIELRDILKEPRYRDELVAARGRPTVPVLRCTSAGHDRWMPESRDIIAYLQRRFG